MHKGTLRNGRGSHNLYAHYKFLRGALSDASHDVKDRMGEIITHSLHDAKIKSTDLKDQVGDYISERPFKSLSLAVLAGIILGYIFKK